MKDFSKNNSKKKPQIGKRIANFIRYRNNKKVNLTYILGARCKDGIVLVSDSRITRGNDITQDVKIMSPINGAVIGASGVTGLFTKFLNQINDLIANEQIKTWDELLIVVEDLVLKLDARYRERTFGTIEVLMSTKKFQNSAELYLVNDNGLAEEIKNFVTIGHGEPYGSLFMKAMWNKEMTMQQTAELAAFIITTIAVYAIDNSVDSVPQIWFIPFKGDIRQLTRDEQVKITQKAYVLQNHLDSFLKDLLDNKQINDVLKMMKSDLV